MTNDKPHMTLENGEKLYEGEYGITRNGDRVGPDGKPVRYLQRHAVGFDLRPKPERQGGHGDEKD